MKAQKLRDADCCGNCINQRNEHDKKSWVYCVLYGHHVCITEVCDSFESRKCFERRREE